MIVRRLFTAIENRLNTLSAQALLRRTNQALLCFGPVLVLLLSAPIFAQTIPQSRHVVLVIEENQQYSDVLAQMPWLTSKGNQYGYAANYQADTSGSLMDYLWLSSGSCEALSCDPSPVPPGSGDFGCSGSDCTSAITDANIFAILSNPNDPRSWKEYMESYTGWDGPDTSLYVKRHNPAAWYSAVINNPALQANIVDFGSNFLNDANANNLPNYSIVVPNLQDDAHDGTPGQADTWLQNNIGPILNTPPFQPGGDGLLIVTFDECDAAAGGNCPSGLEHVYTAVIGPQVVPGTVSNTLYKHEHTLHTILQALGMSDFPLASGSVTGMTDFFASTGHLVSNIDDMTFTCLSPCSGSSGPDTSSGNQLDGSSLKADYLGGSAFSDAVFDTTPNIDISSATQFSLDFWVQVSAPSAPQALEFSMIQDVNGQEYAFQHQCDFKGSTMWRVWNPANGGSWVDTGRGCATFGGTWNHFTLHFSRNSSNQLVYTDIVINGTTYSWNSGLVFNSTPTSNGNSVTFRTRLVGDGTPTPYTIWIDSWNLN